MSAQGVKRPLVALHLGAGCELGLKCSRPQTVSILNGMVRRLRGISTAPSSEEDTLNVALVVRRSEPTDSS